MKMKQRFRTAGVTEATIQNSEKQKMIVAADRLSGTWVCGLLV